MLNLIKEYLTNGYITIFIFLISLIAIIFGISVIIAKNPIVSVLFLIGLFFSISLYLISIGLDFIGLSYLLVYVGAVSILFLFILMLINVRVSELITEGKNSIPLAIISGLCFALIVEKVLPNQTDTISIWNTEGNSIKYLFYSFTSVFNVYIDKVNSLLLNVFSNNWDGFLIESTHISSIGNVLYSSLFIQILVISLILLLAMIGTIIITVERN